MRQLTDDINAGKGAIGKFAHDKEFADKLQTTMNNGSPFRAAGQRRGLGRFALQRPSSYNNSNQMLVETRVRTIVRTRRSI